MRELTKAIGSTAAVNELQFNPVAVLAQILHASHDWVQACHT